jgi:predicted metalloprotease
VNGTIDQLVLAMEPLAEAVFDAGLLGCSLGALDQVLGLLRGVGQEVAAADLEHVVDEAFEGRPIADGEVSL